MQSFGDGYQHSHFSRLERSMHDVASRCNMNYATETCRAVNVDRISVDSPGNIFYCIILECY